MAATGALVKRREEVVGTESIGSGADRENLQVDIEELLYLLLHALMVQSDYPEPTSAAHKHTPWTRDV